MRLRLVTFSLALLSCSVAFGQDHSTEFFDAALQKFRQCKFKELIQDCDSAIDSDSSPILATGFKALAMAQLGEHETAIAKLNSTVKQLKANQVEPLQHATLHCCSSLALIRIGKHEPAMKAANLAIELLPDHPFPHYCRASIHSFRGQHDLALRSIDNCLRLQDDFAMALLLKGVCLSGIWEQEPAIEAMEKSIMADHGKYVSAICTLAMEMGTTYEFERANQLLDHAETIHSDCPSIYTARAFLLDSEGKHETALKYLEKAKKLNAEQFETFLAETHGLINEQQFDQALVLAEKGVANYPHLYHSFFLRGTILSFQNQTEAAIRDFEKANQLNPTHSRPPFMIGTTYFQSDQFESAVTPLRTATRLNPRYWPAQLLLGQTYVRLGQYEQAIECFDRSVQIVDDYGYAFAQRALAYEALGKHEQAETDFMTAKELGWVEEK